MPEKIKFSIKKGDKVKVVSGKDRGKTGKVSKIIVDKSRATVEGLTKIKRHAKPTQKVPQGGIIEKDATIHVSNLLPVCPSCGEAARVGRIKEDGTLKRVCSNCKSVWETTK